MTPENLKAMRERLLEKLSSIEHGRWSKWKKYIYSKCIPSSDDGIWQIGEEWLTKWQRQIDTPYEELSEKEKDSDREQVLSYLPILESEITQALAERDEEIVKMIQEILDEDWPVSENPEIQKLKDHRRLGERVICKRIITAIKSQGTV